MDQSQQQQEQQQTGLCLRQNINSSRINKKEFKQQEQQQLQLDDNNSKDNNNKTLDTTTSNIATVASNNKQQLQLQHSKDCGRELPEETNDSLKQKNQILVNKYKLIRRTSLTTITTAAKNNVVKQAHDTTRGKEDTLKVGCALSFGGVTEKRNIRKLKFKTPSPTGKTKPINIFAQNYYRKINNILSDGKKEEEKLNIVNRSIHSTTAFAQPSTSTNCSSVIFKSPRRKVHMIMGDNTTTNKFEQSKRRYSLVINKPNKSTDTNTSNATSSQELLQTTQHVAGNRVVPQKKYN